MASRRMISNPADSGMTVAEVLALGPEELARTQYDVLYTAALSILEEFVARLKAGELDKAMEMLTFSRAGDGYGDDNYYIDMSTLSPNMEDMHDVLERLQYFKSILEVPSKVKK